MTSRAAWKAVVARDARHDGRFVYAVSTTGVYCRPSCASRRPRRDRVTFWATPLAAERAGFRACKRCGGRPGSAATGIVRRVVAYLDAHVDERVTLSAIAKSVGTSPFHLQRTFTEAMGVSPRAYLRARRIERLRSRLRSGADVTAAIYDAGFGAPSRLYEDANADLGMTPGTFRRGGSGMTIEYTVVPSPLGRLLVGETSRGVCAVSLGDDDRTLVRDLQARYPRATVARASRVAGRRVRAIVAHLRGRRGRIDLPLDLRATSFQLLVWSALRAIPWGETRSYSALAASIGRPRAWRAVANACASNPVAVVVPCHRAVRESGALGGYRWGLARKRKLLAAERT